MYLELKRIFTCPPIVGAFSCSLPPQDQRLGTRSHPCDVLAAAANPASTSSSAVMATTLSYPFTCTLRFAALADEPTALSLEVYMCISSSLRCVNYGRDEFGVCLKRRGSMAAVRLTIVSFGDCMRRLSSAALNLEYPSVRS